MSTPWNSRCATCIVRSAEKPNLRLASCCSVDVVNGGAGRCVNGFSSTLVTVPRQIARERVDQRVRLRLVEHAHALAGQLPSRVEVLAGRDALVAERARASP